MTLRRAVVSSLLVVAAFAQSTTARAQCTTLTEASAVLAATRSAIRCNNKILRYGPGTMCTVKPPPACAGSLVTDAVALGYGANNPPTAKINTTALRDQLRCQKAIGRGVWYFVGRKLRLLIKGYSATDAEAKARRYLDKLPTACAVTVAQDASTVILPDVGKQCDAAVGAPGSPVDAAALRDALITLLETWVDRVGPNAGPLRPNIVLILADDQRFDTIGTTHSIDGVTPVMPNVVSELVSQGCLFDNSFATTALCAPSRSSMLAAKYSHTTGVHSNGGSDGGFGVFNDTSTVAVWLKAAGYHTGLFGKYLNGYNTASPYTPPGWDEWHAFKAPKYYSYTLAENGVEQQYGSTDADYSTDVLRDKVVQFIQASAGNGPFFVEFTPYAPHAPATPATRYVGMFSGVSPWRPPNYAEADVSDKPMWVQNLTWDANDTTQTDAFRQKQLECLQAVDEAVGMIMQTLRDAGIDKNTIVVYAADNGYSWGSHRWKPKQCPYEECMRVPLVVRYPALVPLPRSEGGMALNIDYSETFAELAGATPDPGAEGSSLVRLLDGTIPSWRSDFTEEHWDGVIPDFTQTRGLQSKTVDYVTGEHEQYDLVADPFELNSLVH